MKYVLPSVFPVLAFPALMLGLAVLGSEARAEWITIEPSGQDAAALHSAVLSAGYPGQLETSLHCSQESCGAPEPETGGPRYVCESEGQTVEGVPAKRLMDALLMIGVREYSRPCAGFFLNTARISCVKSQDSSQNNCAVVYEKL